MKVKETVQILPDNLRNLAIRENWFTKATNEQYDIWLEYVRDKDLTKDDLLYLALVVDAFSVLPDYGGKAETLENIMFIIGEEVHHFYELEAE